MKCPHVNEFTPERVMMEAIVKKFRQYGWFVTLFELNPNGQGWVGKGDLLFVRLGAVGEHLALAVEAKILLATPTPMGNDIKSSRRQ